MSSAISKGSWERVMTGRSPGEGRKKGAVNVSSPDRKRKLVGKLGMKRREDK